MTRLPPNIPSILSATLQMRRDKGKRFVPDADCIALTYIHACWQPGLSADEMLMIMSDAIEQVELEGNG